MQLKALRRVAVFAVSGPLRVGGGVPGQQTHSSAVLKSLHSVAVVFHLVEPVGSFRQRLNSAEQHGRDELKSQFQTVAGYA